MDIKIVAGNVEVTRTVVQSLNPSQVADRKQMLNMELGQLEQEYVQRKADLEKQLTEAKQMEAALKSASVEVLK